MRTLTCLALMFSIACGDDDRTTADGGPDTGRRDTGGDTDGVDTGGVDVGSPDVSVPDTGPMDCTAMTPPSVGAESIAPGHRFNNPLYVTSAPGDPDTLYVVQRGGRIMVVQDGSVRETPFFEATGINAGGEQGLLGLAFHPDYAANGRFFVYFTPRDPARNAVAEFRRSDADPYVADNGEVARLMDLIDSEENHNGGMITFGPDGFLYVAVGDEGGGGDRHPPIGNGLNKQTLFGNILRLDVDNAPSYAAAGNPFSGDSGLPQIYAYGLRNPWRFSFDRVTQDLYIADVGEIAHEEVTVIPRGTPPGQNLGWRIYEGNSIYDPGLLGSQPELVANHFPPIVDVNHDLGACSITGGYVYRGDAIPALRGWYLFSDFCKPDVVAFRYCGGEATSMQTIASLTGLAGSIASFGEDGNGEMYMVYLSDGEVLRIVGR